MSDEDATVMLATCLQQVVRDWLVEYGERHDTWTNGQHYTVTPLADQSDRQVASDILARMLRGNCSRGIWTINS